MGGELGDPSFPSEVELSSTSSSAAELGRRKAAKLAAVTTGGL
jgi:hypothetical protein